MCLSIYFWVCDRLLNEAWSARRGPLKKLGSPPLYLSLPLVLFLNSFFRQGPIIAQGGLKVAMELRTTLSSPSCSLFFLGARVTGMCQRATLLVYLLETSPTLQPRLATKPTSSVSVWVMAFLLGVPQMLLPQVIIQLFPCPVFSTLVTPTSVHWHLSCVMKNCTWLHVPAIPNSGRWSRKRENKKSWLCFFVCLSLCLFLFVSHIKTKQVPSFPTSSYILSPCAVSWSLLVILKRF